MKPKLPNKFTWQKDAKTGWRRLWFTYYAILELPDMQMAVTKRLGLITYWLIYYVHGPGVLRSMARNVNHDITDLRGAIEQKLDEVKKKKTGGFDDN